MFEKICVHCKCPLSFYNDKNLRLESCRVIQYDMYGNKFYRHQFENNIINSIKTIFVYCKLTIKKYLKTF